MKTKTILCFFLFSVLSLKAFGEAEADTIIVNIDYSYDRPWLNYPVVVSLKDYPFTTSSRVYFEGKELPSQLDDLEGDGINDEMCFLVDLKRSGTYTCKVVLSKTGTQKDYPLRTYAELLLTNPKVKDKTKQNLYIRQLVVTKELEDSYHLVHHHGIAFENELIALRIYFDKRQTLDLYGKKRMGLELHDTQFYTTQEQRLQGYGEDILWTGNSMGLGALRGWSNGKTQMLDDVVHRGQRIVSHGPIRTIVEMSDGGWLWKQGQRVNLTERYTLYAGHRDICVEAWAVPVAEGLRFATGLMHMAGVSKLSDHKGLRGLWGTNWPAKDTTTCTQETLGMGIYVPAAYLQKELACDGLDDAYVLAPVNGHLKYYLTYSADKEAYGYHQAYDWFAYLKQWKAQLLGQPRIKISRRHSK